MSYPVNLKIINDPVYGFIEVPLGFMLDLLEHPWVQRLRRIRQGGFSHLVYPGATHTRFHHVLGAYHLAHRAIHVLRNKGVHISAEEGEALQIALLLHDMGHGPFSHSLEGKLWPVAHEMITLKYMHQLNRYFEGRLGLAIAMFTRRYSRPFFHQLISGALDLDRLDYLARDSFYTGVSEGVIGYDRIIYMLNVVDDRLVVEEKGLNSIEKFILARKLMYAQVYHHKMVLASEEMLRAFMDNLRSTIRQGKKLPDQRMIDFITNQEDWSEDKRLKEFSEMDDSDVIMLLKSLIHSDIEELSVLADGLINRRLFALYFESTDGDSDLNQGLRQYIDSLPDGLVLRGRISHYVHTPKDNITILMKNGQLKSYETLRTSVTSDYAKSYLCFPKESHYS